MHVHVLDHFEEWAEGVARFEQTLNTMCARITLSVRFEQLDMLSPDSMPRSHSALRVI